MIVDIEKLDHYGRGITKINGKICFVENALPKETVEIKIIKEAKKYFLAETKKIINKSKDRVIPPCKYASICGGCNLEHLSFSKENGYKVTKIKEIIKKFANEQEEKVKPIIYDKEYHYRNKITFHQKNGKIGLYQKQSKNIIPIDNCLLITEELEQEIKHISAGKETEIILRMGNKTKEILNSNKENKYILSMIGNKVYQVSQKSFFQVNPIITEKLYEEIKDIVKHRQAKNVLDLYCGTGSIGIYISEEVEKVLGIESVKEAVIDAKENAKRNNIKNCSYLLGKVEELTEKLTEGYDTAIIDPPRKGLDKKVIEKLLQINPQTIIYVSCDPVTLARDINLLKTSYNLEYIRPYNMFPRTFHVECCALLSLKTKK